MQKNKKFSYDDIIVWVKQQLGGPLGYKWVMRKWGFREDCEGPSLFAITPRVYEALNIKVK